MANQVFRYTCGICKAAYENIDDAYKCEFKGFPFNPYYKGAYIIFDLESQISFHKYTYSEKHGEILDTFILPAKNVNDAHIWACVVKVNGEDSKEFIVVSIEVDLCVFKNICLDGYVVNAGYADSLNNTQHLY